MTTLLAIIGLIVVLHFISKGLIKIGTILEHLGESLEDCYSSNIKIKSYHKNSSTKDKIDIMSKAGCCIKESDENEKFKNKIQKEIDELIQEKD